VTAKENKFFMNLALNLKIKLGCLSWKYGAEKQKLTGVSTTLMVSSDVEKAIIGLYILLIKETLSKLSRKHNSGLLV